MLTLLTSSITHGLTHGLAHGLTANGPRYSSLNPGWEDDFLLKLFLSCLFLLSSLGSKIVINYVLTANKTDVYTTVTGVYTTILH